jgi:MFS family permease
VSGASGSAAVAMFLLLARQGFGAISMPIAGRLTDRTGVGRIVPVGLTAYWWAFALVVVALVIATPLLPKDKPPPVEAPGAEAAGAGAPPAVLVH